MAWVVVGDIHGEARQLEWLLKRPELDGRQVVFLGDYVDVGDESKQVLEILKGFAESRPDARFLMGNHEAAFLDYLRTGAFFDYASVGGIATIRSYCGEVSGDVHAAMLEAVPQSHRQFLASLDDYIETDEYLFSHSGYDPNAPHDRSRQAMVLSTHEGLLRQQAPSLGKVAVCGHYFQRDGKPLLRRGVICLDTGCSIFGGPLTAIVLPDMHFIQVARDLTTSVLVADECSVTTGRH